MSTRHDTTSLSNHSCHSFFEGWLARQQGFLDQLVGISTTETNDNEECHYQLQYYHNTIVKTKLIEQVLSHYKEYYDEKGRAIRQDAFCIFSPSWLTSFEKTFLWVGGFRPSLAFHLVEASVSNMVSEQVKMIEGLKAVTAAKEKTLMDAFATVQESVGSLPLLGLARRVGSLVDGEVLDLAEAIHELKEAMAEVVAKADDIRRSTVMKVVGILNRDQTVEFLAAVARCQLGVRALGLQMDDLPTPTQ